MLVVVEKDNDGIISRPVIQPHTLETPNDPDRRNSNGRPFVEREFCVWSEQWVPKSNLSAITHWKTKTTAQRRRDLCYCQTGVDYKNLSCPPAGCLELSVRTALRSRQKE